LDPGRFVAVMHVIQPCIPSACQSCCSTDLTCPALPSAGTAAAPRDNNTLKSSIRFELVLSRSQPVVLMLVPSFGDI
jgi:hypothetical protein